MRARISGGKPLVPLALACALVLFRPAPDAEGAENPLATHQALTARVSSRTKWLFTAPVGKEGGETNPVLLAFTLDGDFHPIAFRKTDGRLRARVEDHPAPSDLSANVPPAQLPDGSFAGAGESGMFINVDAADRRWLFVWPSARPSTLSKPAVLGRSAVAMAGADGSILLFRKRRGEWAEVQRVEAKAARAPPDAALTTADLDGDGKKELIAPAAPDGGLKPTEIHAYQFDGKSLERIAAYPAGGDGAFEAPAVSDLDKDGNEEILITRNVPGGEAAHLVLGMRSGEFAVEARSRAVSGRSRLLGAFGLDGGEPKALAVEEPRRAGFLLALRLSGGRLRERARVAGFTTRAAGSRGPRTFALLRRRGIVEVALQQAGGRRLSGLALFGSRWRLRWSRPIPSPVRSNILAADFNRDAKDDLAFVDQSGLVHVYLSK